MTAEIVDQLCDEVDARLVALAPFVGVDTSIELAALLEARCRSIVAQLCGDDDRLAAGSCVSIMCVLWSTGDPEDSGNPQWWRTPLGQACARSLGRTDAEAVTHSVAAAMLGVAKGTVSTMVSRGTLDRHPDGGVLRASVLQRLGR